MDSEQNIPITPFDGMLMRDSLQIWKAAMPYLPCQLQSAMAFWIKWRELRQTMAIYGSRRPDLAQMSVPRAVSPTDMLSDMRQYLGDGGKEKLDQLLFAINAVLLIQNGNEPSSGGEEPHEF